MSKNVVKRQASTVGNYVSDGAQWENALCNLSSLRRLARSFLHIGTLRNLLLSSRSGLTEVPHPSALLQVSDLGVNPTVVLIAEPFTLDPPSAAFTRRDRVKVQVDFASRNRG